jgi:phosphate transport system substrate-binding protein
MKKNPALFLLLFLLPFLGCGESKPTEEIDTPIRGKVKISIDENIRPLVDELIDAFEYSYPDAFLYQRYGSEKTVLQELYDDTTKLAVMTRRLNDEEREYFKKKTYSTEEIKIGSDAVVFLVNRENPDSIFTVDQIRRMLLGQDSLWAQINPNSKLGRIHLVFDNPASSNLRYLTDTLLGGQKTGTNCFALQSCDSVIAYVNRNPGAIGIVGLNWLGDRDNEEARNRLSKISLALIGKDSASATHPHQSALTTGAYPFVRGLWIIKIGKRAGLGTGFATFSFGDRGQLIVQRAGLVPAAPAERRIQLTTY